jgi:uncharacterized protein YrzB (UPF0473 family)
MPTEQDNGDGEVEEFDESEGFEPEDLVTITGEDGKPIECAVLAVIEHDSLEFALLAPVEQLTSEEGDEIEMYIFRYEVDEEGNQLFGFVEEDATYDAVRKEFAVLMDQE